MSKEQRFRELTNEELDRRASGSSEKVNPFGKRVMEKIKHLSHSSITMYLNCPQMWYRRYILDQRAPAREPLLYGSAVHKTWTDYQILRANGQSPDSQKIWRTEFSKEVEEREKGEGIDWGDGSAEASYQEGKGLWGAGNLKVDFVTRGWDDKDKDEFVFEHTQAFMDMFPALQTVDKATFEKSEVGVPATERFVSMEVPGVPKKLLGYVDWVGTAGIPHDLKTSGRSWYRGSDEKTIQPNLYLAMMLVNAGQVINPNLFFKYVVLVRNKTPKAQVVRTQRSPSQIQWTLKVVQRVWRDMSSGKVTPNPQFMWCGSGCDFWSSCMGVDEYNDSELSQVLGLQELAERRESNE